MNKTLRTILVLAIVILTLVLLFNNPFGHSDYLAWKDEISEVEYLSALSAIKNSEYITRYSYVSYLEDHEVTYGLSDADATNFDLAAVNDYNYSGDHAVDLAETGIATYVVNVPTAGLYHIFVDVYVRASVLNNLTLAVTVNGETPFDDASTIDVPLLWQDDSKDFVLDTYGDESLPAQQRVLAWQTIGLSNNTYSTSDPLLFELEAGENTIVIDNIMDGDLLVGDMTIVAPVAVPSYAAYISNYDGVASPETTMTINATEYSSKNSSYVRLYAFQSPSVSPYDAVDKKLNVINGDAWDKAGQEVTFTIDVAETGLYHLNLHYLNDKDEFSV
ncbi:MAG: hypothetical protein PHP32_04300, partial [Candidatus Izemoplasmatales bacterium]|nr:hypothetical protein [Candidatus Izemoplasmatales bacterium]